MFYQSEPGPAPINELEPNLRHFSRAIRATSDAARLLWWSRWRLQQLIEHRLDVRTFAVCIGECVQRGHAQAAVPCLPHRFQRSCATHVLTSGRILPPECVPSEAGVIQLQPFEDGTKTLPQ